jgi:predicted metal-dependent hydrolase
MTSTYAWPPPFTVRYSPRARAVSLRICARRGLQIVVPRYFDEAQAPKVLEQHKPWIERTWQRIKPQMIVGEAEELVPVQVVLQALNETWSVQYVAELANKKLWRELPAEKCLIINANSAHHRKVRKILLSWLQQRAKGFLLPLLAALSQQTGLLYARASVRHAATRWGSCSAHKTISLNCKLLFLPQHLVEYVLIHELCHTVHLNHSRHFWDLVKRFSPDCHQSRKQLKQENKLLPTWIEH